MSDVSVSDDIRPAEEAASTSRGSVGWINRPAVVLSAFAVVVVSAVSILRVGSIYGVGLTPDSVTYASGARILATRPWSVFSLSGDFGAFSRFPPLFSLVLAVPGWFGVDALDAASAVSAVLVVVFLVLMWVLVSRYTSPIVGVAACAVMVVMGNFVLTNFGWVLAESLSLVLVVATLVVFDRMLNASGSSFWLYSFLTGVLVGLALLTKLLGVGLFGAMVLSAMLFAPKGKRMKAAMVIGLPAVLLVSAWLMGRPSSGGVAGRPVEYHPPRFTKLGQLGESVNRSVVPVWLNVPAIGIAVAAMASLWGAWFIWSSLRGTPSPRDRFTAVLTIFVYAHTLGLLVATTFFDSGIPFDLRLMGSVIPAVVTIVAIRVTAAPAPRARWVRGLAVAMTALLLFGAATRTVYAVKYAREFGLGYSGPEWVNSATIDYIRALPEDMIVFTNSPDVVYLKTGRVTQRVPEQFSINAAEAVDSDPAMKRMSVRLRDEQGVVVLFAAVRRRYLANAQDLVDATGLEVIQQLDDGVVLAPPVDQ